eukprot:XP_011681411.1 PREDICTED: receptor-type tyrosine-protein phosphatase O-like [Strongylocentrotus purpuratus]
MIDYEHSRVKLAALADDSDTDYINANYIPGYNSPREFMACQGPLPGTVDDMWRMIWEKKTSIIVMLTQLVEKGKFLLFCCIPFRVLLRPDRADPAVHSKAVFVERTLFCRVDVFGVLARMLASPPPPLSMLLPIILLCP